MLLSGELHLDPLQELDRSAVASFRAMMARLGAVVAEVDDDLRYVWIENPHADFDVTLVVGKRDDELTTPEDAAGITRFKAEAFRRGHPLARTLVFLRSDGPRAYRLYAYPVREADGRRVSLVTVGFDVPLRAARGARVDA